MPESMLPDKESSIQDWWDKAHALKHTTWLTGSLEPEVWHALKITRLIQPGTQILNIGVGLGHCTRGLAELGAKVSALDISQLAIDGVRDVIESGFLANQISDLPQNSYDLVISNLVTQHMLDEDLETQLLHVIKSLKPSGIFAMQFAFYWDQLSPTINNTPYEAKAGGVCRTLGRVTELVERVGGTITWAQLIGAWPAYHSAWYGVHIVKKPSYSFSYDNFDPCAGFSKWGETRNAMEDLLIHVEGVEKDLAEVAKDRELQLDRVAQISLRLENLVKEHAEMKKDRDLQRRNVEQLSQELTQVARDRDLHLRTVGQISHDLQSVLNSKSWRVTRPLRAVMHLLRKMT